MGASARRGDRLKSEGRARVLIGDRVARWIGRERCPAGNDQIEAPILEDPPRRTRPENESPTGVGSTSGGARTEDDAAHRLWRRKRSRARVSGDGIRARG